MEKDRRAWPSLLTRYRVGLMPPAAHRVSAFCTVGEGTRADVDLSALETKERARISSVIRPDLHRRPQPGLRPCWHVRRSGLRARLLGDPCIWTGPAISALRPFEILSRPSRARSERPVSGWCSTPAREQPARSPSSILNLNLTDARTGGRSCALAPEDCPPPARRRSQRITLVRMFIKHSSPTASYGQPQQAVRGRGMGRSSLRPKRSPPAPAPRWGRRRWRGSCGRSKNPHGPKGPWRLTVQTTRAARSQEI